MLTIAELFLFGLTAGTLNKWDNQFDPKDPLDEWYSVPQPEIKSKSLYDLMAHFPTDNDIVCPDSDSRFRYPGECTRYITCRNYNAHIRSCPPGMSYDESYGHCRLSFEVDCEPRRLLASCNADEEYFDCGCERTCRNFDEEDVCVSQCESGCLCRLGFVRDDTGNCVELEACKNSIHSFFNSDFEV